MMEGMKIKKQKKKKIPFFALSALSREIKWKKYFVSWIL